MPRRIVTDTDALKISPFVSLCTLDDDSTISLFFENGTSWVITITDDYPNGTAICFCEQSQQTEMIDGNMQKVYEKLLKLSGDQKKNQNQQNQQQQQGGASEMGTHQKSSASSGMGTGQEGSYGDGMDQSYEEDHVIELSPEVQKDIDLAKKLGFKAYHERVALGFRLFVEFSLADLVSESTALAWGFQRSVNFTIRFVFERPEYLKIERAPIVEITQDGKPCRFGQQLKNMIDTYLTDHWTRSGWKAPLPSNKGVGAASAGAKSSNENTAGRLGGSYEKLMNLLTPPQKEIYDRLIVMGFDKSLAAPAARQSKDISDAVDKCTNGTVLAVDDTIQDSRSWFDSLKDKVVGPNDSKATNDLSSVFSTGIDPDRYVPYFPKEEGWLVHMVRYVRKRTPTAHQVCCICDQKHLIGCSMLKPVICERELCTFRFQELGIGKDATDSVATGGGVIDLLVIMFRMCVDSERRDLICTPYPSVADPKTGKLVLNPNAKDFDKLRQLTKLLPDTRELLGVENINQLSSKLNAKDPLLMPLLSWIISSNRSLIVKLREDQLLKKVATPHQFLLVSSSPEKQQAFEEMKKKKGSVFAWHGSALENFHSIFRNGVKNMSNKPGLMTAGAALGPGVYMATDFSTSAGYARAHGLGGNPAVKGSQDYLDGLQYGKFACMILLEIIKGEYNDHGNVYTCTKEDAIITRFFFIFTDQNQVNKCMGLNTKADDFVKDVTALVNST